MVQEAQHPKIVLIAKQKSTFYLVLYHLHSSTHCLKKEKLLLLFFNY